MAAAVGRRARARDAAAERAPTRLSTRDRVLAGLVPLLVVTVALTQMTLATTEDLTPWRGGGFGMFSTVDAHSARFARLWLVADDGAREPIVESELPGDAEVHRLLVDYEALPDTRRRDAVEAALAAADPDLAGATVRVELWTVSFDLDSGALTPRRLDAAELHP